MKKILSILTVFVISALIVTGCGGSSNNNTNSNTNGNENGGNVIGEKVVCSSTQKDEESGETVTATITAVIQDNKVSGASGTMEFDKEETASQYYSLMQFMDAYMEEGQSLNLKLDGKTVIIGNMMGMLDTEGDEEEGTAAFKVSEATKEEFIKYVEAEGYTCK